MERQLYFPGAQPRRDILHAILEQLQVVEFRFDHDEQARTYGFRQPVNLPPYHDGTLEVEADHRDVEFIYNRLLQMHRLKEVGWSLEVNFVGQTERPDVMVIRFTCRRDMSAMKWMTGRRKEAYAAQLLRWALRKLLNEVLSPRLLKITAESKAELEAFTQECGSAEYPRSLWIVELLNKTQDKWDEWRQERRRVQSARRRTHKF